MTLNSLYTLFQLHLSDTNLSFICIWDGIARMCGIWAEADFTKDH